MASYKEILDYQRKYQKRNQEFDENSIENVKNENIIATDNNSEQRGDNNMSMKKEFDNLRIFPGTIRELLKRFIERRVTIVLDAETEPEKVEIEAVIGDLLVAETEHRKIKFVDIRCICEVIIDREELLESIFHTECFENENENENVEKHECEKIKKSNLQY